VHRIGSARCGEETARTTMKERNIKILKTHRREKVTRRENVTRKIQAGRE